MTCIQGVRVPGFHYIPSGFIAAGFWESCVGPKCEPGFLTGHHPRLDFWSLNWIASCTSQQPLRRHPFRSCSGWSMLEPSAAHARRHFRLSPRGLQHSWLSRHVSRACSRKARAHSASSETLNNACAGDRLPASIAWQWRGSSRWNTTSAKLWPQGIWSSIGPTNMDVKRPLLN